ncbi:MAG: hypothetical protein Q9162_001454 [Coniocarpon cinnabarinum]
MHLSTLFIALPILTLAQSPPRPSLDVPACPAKGTLQYNLTDPDRNAFPLTQADLCYDDTSIHITFTAYNETNFYYNASQTTNDAIYEYEVMEAFIYQGTKDPESYLEFEINPINVTFTSFIYNPSKVRAPGAFFGGAYITDPTDWGFAANTTLQRDKELWVSDATIPLGIFNVDNGTAQGTQWRMNFFRTVVSPDTFPTQLLGAWNPTNESNFHETPFFGDVTFV